MNATVKTIRLINIELDEATAKALLADIAALKAAAACPEQPAAQTPTLDELRDTITNA